MATGQPGIFAQGTRSHYSLEFDVRPGAGTAHVAAAVAALREPTVTAGGFNLVVGFGAALWPRLMPSAETMPGELRAFDTVEGLDGHRAPSTQHDLWIWIHGTGEDLALDAARACTAVLAPVAVLAIEQPCFVYRDSRDLTGFVDGTENPPIDEAPSVALIADGEPGEGGAYVITQRWVHDLEKFHAQTVPEQEGTIGRTKPDSVELDDAVKPPTAHIARVVIEEGGEELEIYRRSTPYGTVGEHGLYFIGFSAELSRFDKMLARIFGLADGIRDHLTDFTRPVSGAYYFAPSLEALAALGVT
ncbi:MAG: Dyp-type peroxidase [Acidimicrobiia bacterium]